MRCQSAIMKLADDKWLVIFTGFRKDFFHKVHKDNIYSGYIRVAKEKKRATKHNQQLREVVHGRIRWGYWKIVWERLNSS